MYFDKELVNKNIERIKRCTGGIPFRDIKFLLGYISFLREEIKRTRNLRIRATDKELAALLELGLAEDTITELELLLEKEEVPSDVAISWSYGEHLGIKNSILVNTRLRISCWLVFTLRENGSTQLEAICSTARMAAQDRRGILHRAKEGFLDKNKVVRCWVETSLINHLLGSTMYTEL